MRKQIARIVFCLLLTCLVNTRILAEQPNFILLMGDDHGWEETGYNGHPYVKTPVLDEIAATGFRFDRFYSAHASCSPTRASFLTGRHPNRMGTFAPGWSFRPEEITMAHLLSKAGYRCAHFGKWHVGTVKAGSPVNPGAMGFDEWLSHDNFFELNPVLSRNGAAPQELTGESSEILVREAIQFIEKVRQQAQPFLVVVWYGSPHEPYSGLPEDLALYADLPAKYSEKMVSLTSNETGEQVSRPQGEVLRERYAEITAMDRSIGVLRDYLAKSGLRDNTLLFYCGDNGTSADGLLASPHRNSKNSIYEGGTRVPGLMEWPAQIPEPRATQLRASTSDLLPTLTGIAGQALPDRPLDGIDLLPALTGTLQQRPVPLYFWMRDRALLRSLSRQPAYIDPEWQIGTTPLAKLSGGKATRNFVNYQHTATTTRDYYGPRAVIDGHYKLVVQDVANENKRLELYDLEADLAEKHNIAEKHPEIVSRLESSLQKWQTSVLNSLTGADYHQDAKPE